MNPATSISNKALIQLRAAGEGLAIPGARIRARQAGAYLSRYKGRGIDFEESRLYQPGDDIRSMDWRVTARTGTPHTKVYREERERPVLFCVDFRSTMFFATRGMFKSVLAARVATLLAWSSAHRGDRVGGLVFSDTTHHELKPRRSAAAVLALIKQLVRMSAFDPAAAATAVIDLERPLARLRRVARPGSLVFIVSDFRALTDTAQSHLIQIARHNSVALILLYDEIETALPPAGIYRVTDGKHRATISTGDTEIRERYAARFQAHRAHLETLCRRHGMSLLPCTTRDDVLTVLQNEMIVRAVA